MGFFKEEYKTIPRLDRYLSQHFPMTNLHVKVRKACLVYLENKADLASQDLLVSEVRTAGPACLELRAGREIPGPLGSLGRRG